MSKPRVKVGKAAKAGDIVQVKALIKHVMETGLRKDKKTGKKIPVNIINKFDVALDGKTVFSADLFPSVSANPYFAFKLKANKPGKLKFTWTEDTGKTWSTEKDLKVG